MQAMQADRTVATRNNETRVNPHRAALQKKKKQQMPGRAVATRSTEDYINPHFATWNQDNNNDLLAIADRPASRLQNALIWWEWNPKNGPTPKTL